MELEPLGGDSKAPRQKKKLTVHASQLVPYEKPYVEPEDLDVGPDATPEDPGYPDSPKSPKLTEDPPPKTKKYHQKTKTKHQSKTEDSSMQTEGRNTSEAHPATQGPDTRSKRRRALVVNVWDRALPE